MAGICPLPISFYRIIGSTKRVLLLIAILREKRGNVNPVGK